MSFVTHKLIKPDTIEARLYQEVLVSRIIEKKNTLVVAPTALGKTIIAVMLAAYVLDTQPTKKILFLAPTKPLVTQHEASFKKFFNIDENEIISITGSIPIKERTEIYKNKKIIQATPQTIENDLLSGKLNLKEFALVIFDEAHRAVGDYAYVFVNLQLQKQNPTCLVLALTASPGSEEEHIQDVCKNLSIKNIEIKDSKDADVKPYVNEIEVTWVKVDLPKEFLTIKSHLDEFQKRQLIALKSLGFAQTENKRFYNKFKLLEMQSNIRKRLMTSGSTQPSLYFASSKCASMLKISHAEELIETQGIGALKNYFDKLVEEANHGKSKAARQIVNDEDIKLAIKLTNKLFDEKVQHPKYAELKRIILKQLTDEPKSKIIVFNHYRDSITEVVEFLTNGEGTEIIKPRKFIGQATKGKEKGMSQKIQQEVLDELRADVHNVLVASSVAEEGLDIPAVELVIFFEPVPSEIRTIQRRGRTGRHSKGKMIVLMAKNTRDEAFYWTARSKERKMKETLHSMKKNNNFIASAPLPAQTLISSFDGEKKENDKIIIFADSREQASTIQKELFSHEDVKLITKALDIGDYVLSKDVCVERKTIEDFLNSMIDGRLFTQLNNLRQNYTKPLIILEGNTTELFTMRNIHKNSILGALTSIALDYQVPVLNSKDSKETADMLYVIAKREQKLNNKEVRIRVGRKGLTLSEQQRFIVEGFPSVGPLLAKSLLEKFGSIKEIVDASEKELQELTNLGKKKAKLIQKVLREKYDENKSTLNELENDKDLDDEEIQNAFDENGSNSTKEVIIDEELEEE